MDKKDIHDETWIYKYTAAFYFSTYIQFSIIIIIINFNLFHIYTFNFYYFLLLFLINLTNLGTVTVKNEEK